MGRKLAGRARCSLPPMEVRAAEHDDIQALIAAYQWLFAPPGSTPSTWDERRAAVALAPGHGLPRRRRARCAGRFRSDRGLHHGLPRYPLRPVRVPLLGRGLRGRSRAAAHRGSARRCWKRCAAGPASAARPISSSTRPTPASTPIASTSARAPIPARARFGGTLSDGRQCATDTPARRTPPDGVNTPCPREAHALRPETKDRSCRGHRSARDRRLRRR